MCVCVCVHVVHVCVSVHVCVCVCVCMCVWCETASYMHSYTIQRHTGVAHSLQPEGKIR